LLSILKQPVKGNAAVSLAYQLIAAKLNQANGACVPADVLNTIAAADAVIGGVVIPPVGGGTVPSSLAGPLAGILDDYNNGRIAGGPAHCD